MYRCKSARCIACVTVCARCIACVTVCANLALLVSIGNHGGDKYRDK